MSSALLLSHEGEYQMSELDIRALETNFEGWKRERAPRLPTSVAFERYAIDQKWRPNIACASLGILLADDGRFFPSSV